jgi:hypothetical protein
MTEEAVRRLFSDQAMLQAVHPMQQEGIRRLIKEPFDYQSFCAKVPLLDKSQCFDDPGFVRDLLVLARERNARMVPSAGTSHKPPSFRIDRASAMGATAAVVDGVARAWGADLAQTVVVFAYPAGVRLPPELAVLELGARPGLLRSLLPELCASFATVVLVCMPQFLTYCVQSGIVDSRTAKQLCCFVGGTQIPPSYSKFLNHHLGDVSQPLNNRIVCSYGVAELGLYIGVQDRLLRSVEGVGTCHPSALYKINKDNYFLEVVNDRLVVTNLSCDSMPLLLRYDTGDVGAWHDVERELFRFDGRHVEQDELFCPGCVAEAYYADPHLHCNVSAACHFVNSQVVFYWLPGREKSVSKATVEEAVRRLPGLAQASVALRSYEPFHPQEPPLNMARKLSFRGPSEKTRWYRT